MKFSRILAAAATAALLVLSSCEEKEEQLGAASISLNPAEVSLTSEAGATSTVNLTATRQWTVNNIPSWLTVTPSAGEGSNKVQTVTLTAKSNPDIDRDANVTFTIGFSEAVLKVHQAGDAGTIADALIYKNDFDKEDAKNNSSWPTLDKTDCWNHEEGNGITSVKYEYTGMSVRQSGKLSNDTGYSFYEGSGRNKIFFGKTSSFAVKDIDLGGKTALALSFGGQRFNQDDKDNTYNPDEFKVYVSVDGIKGVEVPVTFAKGSAPVGNWDLATAKFTVPVGTEKLTVVFKCANLVTTSTGGVYSIDDLQIAVSTGGTALDLTNAVSLGLDQSGNIPESDEVTDLATIIAKDPNSSVTILNATVTAINTRGFIVSDGTNSIYVYKGEDPQVAIGDKVSIIGTFKYYFGEYEITDPSFKKTGTATPVYPTPVEIDKDFLTSAVRTAATDEASTGYNGPWYPKYARVSAKAHIDAATSRTQFLVDGYDGYMSLELADSKLYQDASGQQWGEGNAVEMIGYYVGWEIEKFYHRFLAISVTGEATYTPVEAAVAGDDVFIAANEAHDKQVTNGNAFTYPLVVGDASITFAGASNTGKYYDAGTAVRLGYANTSTLTISANKPIEKIEYLFAANDTNAAYGPVAAEDGTLPELFKVGTCSWNAEKRILTWTGKEVEVVLTYPLANGHYRVQQIGITYSNAAEPFLAANPTSIAATAEDVSAKFKVQSNTTWTITCDKEGDDYVIRPASGEGEAEVTVTFPKNTSTEAEAVIKYTVSANGVDDVVVTVTQDKAVDLTQATDLATIVAKNSGEETGDIIGATVAAVTLKSYVVSDGTNHVYVWVNGDPKVAVGDIVNITGGKVATNNGGLQISGATTTKVKAGTPVVMSNPVDITESFATYSNSGKHPAYVTVTAKPGKSGTYTNLFVDGVESPTASFANPPAINGVSFWDNFEIGATYKVIAFYVGYNSNSKFHQLVYVSHEKIANAAPSLKVDKTAIDVAATATSVTVAVTANIEWTATLTSGTAELAGADGTTGTSVKGNGNGRFMVGFAANEDTENAKTITVTLTGEGVDDVVVTITQAKAVAQGGGGEGGQKTLSVAMIDMARKYSATTNGTQVGTLELATGVVMSVNTDGNNGKFYSNGEEWRLYQTNNPTVTITLSSGELVSVKFNYGVSNGGTLVYNSSNVASDQVVSLSGSSASFTMTSTTGATNGQVKVKSVEIVYK
ncbi:MAG: hypothetical protein IKX45_02480 [Bacteroidales bacterium]|nr:hypothetical protein [Bacteroidales bacterium]